jgi:hypothetical protein
MRTLDVRNGHVEEDIASGREILHYEITITPKTVVVIRGNTPEITRFADKVAGRCDPFPWREAIWVKDDRIFGGFPEAELTTLFPESDDRSLCGVIIYLDNKPVKWMKSSLKRSQIDRALREVEIGG